jgi:hypothetical protein
MRDRGVGLVGAIVLVAFSACQSNPSRSPAPPRVASTPSSLSGTPSQLAAARGGYVSSLDAQGSPQFVWAVPVRPSLPGLDTETAARAHLDWFAPALGLDSTTVRGAQLGFVHDVGHGPLIVHLHQQVDGIDVYRSEAKVLMRRDLSLVAIAGNLKPRALIDSAAHARFLVSPPQALSLAVNDIHHVTLPTAELVPVRAEQPNEFRFQLAASDVLQLSGDARATKLFFEDQNRLVPAWAVEFFAGLPNANDTEAHRVIVSAEDGRVLDRRDLTQNDVFKYRVWVDANNRPLDGPQSDFSPHPTGVPDGSQPTFIPSGLVSMDGFNHNPAGKGDPWVTSSTTQSLGNNVDCYTDTVPPDGYSNGDFRATTTSAKTFDRTYDVTLAPTANQTQGMASITQVFYLMNWLHDWYYDSGFNEVAMNAQANNLGRGGAQGDVLHSELQDSYPTQKNNANMSTPADGLSPRMQMYVWSGEENKKLTGPDGDLNVGSASFGQVNFNVSGNIVLADDGSLGTAMPPTGSVNDACEPITNNVSGAIALIDRGTCSFTVKVKNAQTAGAIAVLIANNAPAVAAPGMSGTDATVTIPVLSVSQEDGTKLKGEIAAGPVSATLFRQVGVERDGSLDNTVVAHEWGHYLHHRLADCGAGQCNAMSEGWADFNALMLVLRDGDNLDGAYPLSVYASRALADAYFGIRRYPYSVNPAMNALSLRHIAKGAALPNTPGNPFGDNFEVHNAGEIWASMMFETYVSLQKARSANMTFEDMHRQMGDYVVAGLQMTPVDATYLEQRDAMLAAIAANSSADLDVAAHAFARRGAGSCAIVPDRYSPDFTGITEASDLKPILQLGDVKLDDSVSSCDQDGVLDAGEKGKLTLTIANAGPVALSDTQVQLNTQALGIVFPSGGTLSVGNVAPFSSKQIAVDVEMQSWVTVKETLSIDLQLTNPASCTTSVQRTFAQIINSDDVQNLSTIDTVDSDKPAWTRAGTTADQLWLRTEVAPADHAWVGTDADTATDTQLVSPDLMVTAAPLTISFDHKFTFESDTKPTYYDGGVVEVSSDGGTTWVDVGTLGVTPGYGGALATGNALVGRQAYVGQNPSWPSRDHVTLALGTQFAGKTLKMRFREVTDSGTGAYGWEIDNISVDGISNKPFSGLVDDTNDCSTPCPAGLSACNGACVHVATDPANCGTCGNACPAGNVCANGQCALSCPAGLTNCSGSCVNTASDNTSCGACGQACGAGKVCSAGSCQLTCGGGEVDCNGSCANLQSDDAHCGACGTTCELGSTCIAGSCQTPPPMKNPDMPQHSGCSVVLGGSPELPVVVIGGLVAVLLWLEGRRRRRVSSR